MSLSVQYRKLRYVAIIIGKSTKDQGPEQGKCGVTLPTKDYCNLVRTAPRQVEDAQSGLAGALSPMRMGCTLAYANGFVLRCRVEIRQCSEGRVVGMELGEIPFTPGRSLARLG